CPGALPETADDTVAGRTRHGAATVRRRPDRDADGLAGPDRVLLRRPTPGAAARRTRVDGEGTEHAEDRHAEPHRAPHRPAGDGSGHDRALQSRPPPPPEPARHARRRSRTPGHQVSRSGAGEPATRGGFTATYSLRQPPSMRCSTPTNPLCRKAARIVSGGTHSSIVSQ